MLDYSNSGWSLEPFLLFLLLLAGASRALQVQAISDKGGGHGVGLACRCGVCHSSSAPDVWGLASVVVSCIVSGVALGGLEYPCSLCILG